MSYFGGPESECPDLLQALVDCYTHFKRRQYYLSESDSSSSSSDSSIIDIRSFFSSQSAAINPLSSLKSEHPAAHSHLLRALAFYEQLFIPAMRFRSLAHSAMMITGEDVRCFTRYSAAVEHAIRYLWATQPTMFPMQVDLMIVPSDEDDEDDDDGSHRQANSNSNSNSSSDQSLSISELLAAHGIECVCRPLPTQSDEEDEEEQEADEEQKDSNVSHSQQQSSSSSLSSLLSTAILSLLSDSDAVRHPRLVVAIDRRSMQVMIYVVNPVFVTQSRFHFAASAKNCIFQTANFLLPMKSKPSKHWQMSGDVKVIITVSLLIHTHTA